MASKHHPRHVLNREKMNLETAKISWKELQRFFANGSAVYVATSLDLIEVAQQFSLDNKAQVEQWIEEGRVGKVSDRQALEWYEQGAAVWTVVVKPWVLVQSVTT